MWYNECSSPTNYIKYDRNIMMNNDYKKNFMKMASSFDAMIGGEGEITKLASDIAERKTEQSIIEFYRKIIDVFDDERTQKNVKQVAVASREALILFLGFDRLREICVKEKKNLYEEEKTLEQLLEELNDLVGLEKVKAEVNDLIAYQAVQKMRKQQGLFVGKNTLHMAFTGNPGTGKTTVARIVGRMYKQLGLLSKGHFLEVSRTDLIAGYQGQTALKVKEVIESIKGGVLFIDEAYSITENDHSDSYGRECLTELTKALEDYRDDLVVIVAGYTEPMNKFFESNPGLKSRFNKFIDFSDYDEDELFDIFHKMCIENDYKLSEKAERKLRVIMKNTIERKGEQFANGRFVRNLYEDITMRQAHRIFKMEKPTKEVLVEIIEDDVRE